MKPIYDAVLNYVKARPARFHMPAHFGSGDEQTLLYSAARFDVTELGFSDNLQNPIGIIAESERLAAADYGAARCYYFTSGATTALFCAIASVKDRGNKIIVERASHKSVYAALRLFGFEPYYIMPSFENGLPIPLTADDVSEAISKCPDAAAVVITSPNYFGLCADEDISAVCKKHGITLISDSAHGAHFPFSDLLPKGFTSLADLTVVSLHKTLSVYTGGAALLCNDSGLFDKIQALRADLHTTSPSYVVLASMDYALDEARTSGQSRYRALNFAVESLRSSLDNVPFVNTDDFTRLVAKVGKKGFELLRKNNVVPETTYGDYAVFITSPDNANKLCKIEGALKGFTPVFGEGDIPLFPTPERGITGTRCEFVGLADAVGRTSAAEVGVYPPGIPVVARREVITPSVAEILSGADTFGFVNNKICVTIKDNN